MHTTRVEWTADEINYKRKFWGRNDEGEVVPARGRANERGELSGKHEVIKRGDKERKVTICAQAIVRLHDTYEEDLERMNRFIELARQIFAD